MIEISFSYKPIFKLSLMHTWYAEKPGSDFRLVPTAETQRLAKKLGIISKDADGEHFLLYEPDKLEGLMYELENKYPVKFTYLLYSANPYFINITQVPLERRSEIFYFSNNKVSHSQDSVLLHAADFAGKEESVELIKQLEVSADGQEKHIVLKDDFDKIVYENRIGGYERVVINNTVVPIGKYQVFINGKALKDLVLYTDVPVQKPLAVVDISLTGIVFENVTDGIREKNVPFFDYRIMYSARNTFWKYYLIGKYNNNLKNTTIDTGGSSFKFKGPEEVKLQNGRDAIMFVSEQPLPLKQIQSFRFQLKSLRAGILNGKTIMDKLPFASPEMVKPESRDDDSKVYSEILVYI